MHRIRRKLAKRILILDGAIGTELERRGCPTPAPLWSAAALLDHPDLVRAIHHAYAAAGADVLVANTFRTNPRALRAAGLLHRGPELTARAIRLARQAADDAGRDCLVAGSVAPAEDCYRPDLTPADDALTDEHARLAEWLAGAGADFALIETQHTVREARAAATAAAQHNLPFALSFITRADGALLSGEPLAAAVTALADLQPLALGLNCVPPTGLTANLPHLAARTDLPLMAYAHVANTTPLTGWDRCENPPPAVYATEAARWIAHGARLVGGCCGTRPDHIAALRQPPPPAIMSPTRHPERSEGSTPEQHAAQNTNAPRRARHPERSEGSTSE